MSTKRTKRATWADDMVFQDWLADRLWKNQCAARERDRQTGSKLTDRVAVLKDYAKEKA